jgi:hypothetical protein
MAGRGGRTACLRIRLTGGRQPARLAAGPSGRATRYPRSRHANQLIHILEHNARAIGIDPIGDSQQFARRFQERALLYGQGLRYTTYDNIIKQQVHTVQCRVVVVISAGTEA